MKFLIAERISANKYKTPEGYLVCVDSVLARTGKQTYRKNEIFVDCNDDTEIEVDRRPEEVFSEATLASFENKPITIEHPDEDVNTGNFKNLAVGFVRDIHRGKDNGQDVMLGTLVITDEEAISAVESGELLDLSCGYDCDIEDSANPQQRNIRGNHVALCENGRAGIARIVDSIEDEKTFKIGWIRRSTDKAEYSNVPANTEDEAKKKLKNAYGKEVYRIFECKLNDSEETQMKDKLVDIPSNLLSKLEDMFKQKNIHVARKGKTFTGRIHYQVEFGGRVRDLVRKLEEIEKTAKSLNIPMTFAADGNDDDTFATAGVDFDKQYAADSDVEDGKNAAENAVESAMKELGITKEQLSSRRKDVEMKISSKGLYGRTQAGWFVDDYIKNYCKDSEELISDDEDIFTKAINDEVTAIELYNQILAGDLDDETRAIIEEIRDDENDHLVKLTKLKNNISSNDDEIKDEEIHDANLGTEEKIYEAVRQGPQQHPKIIQYSIVTTPAPSEKFIENLKYWPYGTDANKNFKPSLIKHPDAFEFGRWPNIIAGSSQSDVDQMRKILAFFGLTKTRAVKESGTYWLHLDPSQISTYERNFKSYSQKHKKDSINDAMQTFEIRWIDTYKKSKGYGKDEYLHIDKIKANTLSEALKKLADDVALAGVGTMNAMVVSIHSDKASYMYSGKLGELVRKVKDSSKIERAINAIRAMRKI